MIVKLSVMRSGSAYIIVVVGGAGVVVELW